MNKTNLKCPRCQYTKLYNFGFDKQANQKYQCKKFTRQFVLGDRDGINRITKGPKRPRCNHAMYLHHRHNYYNLFKCGNRKCNHIIVDHHSLNIDKSSSEQITGSLSMKGMRFPLQVILNARTLYFLNNSSTRSIAQFFEVAFNIKVSHVTIANWVTKFAPYFKAKSDTFTKNSSLDSDD